MHLVALAWMYVVVMMAVAEATSANGTLLGAVFTFLLYGVLPLSIVMYLMGTPRRRRARKLAEQQQEREQRAREQQVQERLNQEQQRQALDTADVADSADGGSPDDPDGRGHAAGGPVAPVGKEP